MFIPILICILILGLFSQSGCAFPKNSQQVSLSETQLSRTANAFSEQRQQMLSQQIKARGIKNKAVIEAISKVPRHLFVAPSLVNWAYADSPLPIDYGQTISQPYIVAYMTEMAEIGPKDKVLEIGTGSGYQAAVLSELAQEVYSIEIIPELGQKAAQTLKKLGYNHVHIRIGDGYEGWPEHAPYDSILVTAAPEQIPPALVDQLALNGKMVIPVGKYFQEIVILTKTIDGLEEERTIPVRFVPMTTNSED
jgi:protein-L-isoaspartate(D-aspartate) O-methyltransferase